MKRELTSEEIETLASREGARRIAVENFLGTLPMHTTLSDDCRNLRRYTFLYSWKTPTVKAIYDGIVLAHID